MFRIPITVCDFNHFSSLTCLMQCYGMLWDMHLCVVDVRLSFENTVYSKTEATKTIEINILIQKRMSFFKMNFFLNFVSTVTSKS